MPRVSVVVPVHNAERHIDRCAQSILDQRLREIELVLVDDASTDGSLAAIKRIARTDPRVSCVVNESNLGPARSRCLGIEHSTSPYVMQGDADDYVHKNFCRQMLEVAEREQCDLVCSNVYADRGGKIEPLFRDVPVGRFSNQQDILRRFFESRAWHLYRYILRRDLFERAKPFLYANMLPGLVMDDFYFSYCMWLHTDAIVGIPKRLYYRCENRESLTFSRDPTGIRRNITQGAAVAAFVERDLAERQVSDSVKRTYEKHVLTRNMWGFLQLIQWNSADEATKDELLELIARSFSPRMLLYLSPDSDVKSDRLKVPMKRRVKMLLPHDSFRGRLARRALRGSRRTLGRLARSRA